ncbi:olfactory receptor 6N1-like [Erpetoichthys calabaricus]|uniref:olfactory receptor 6N1-like n=1 Tax=Erpetoichthys calabaricus TaxID=27687 RepID=UPI0022344C5F|nr:olfactory receptor 6N1-like [Erpetoichthys calabaricus]
MESPWIKRRLLGNSSQDPIAEIFLLGFAGIKQYPQMLGVLFFIVYILSIFGNIFVFCVIKKEEQLHTPMYIIISNLALSDIVYTTIVMPKIIEMYLFNNYAMQFNACVVQMCFLHFLAIVESFLLVAMALDRYVSICNPLRYPSLITHNLTYVMCLVCWVCPLFVPGVLFAYYVGLPYCGPNKIPHLYCEYALVVRLACTDTTSNVNVGITLGCVVLLVCFSIICLSYLQIIITIFKVTQPGGRSKAFYTCSTQLVVICIFMIPRIFAYISLNFSYMPSDLRIALGFFYTVFPPFIHPVIYSLRTKEIRAFILKSFRTKRINIPRVKLDNISA